MICEKIDFISSFEYLIIVIYSNKFKMVFIKDYLLADNKRKNLIKLSNNLYQCYMCKVPSFLRKNSKMELDTIYIIDKNSKIN